MNSQIIPAETSTLLSDQPIKRVVRDGVEYVLLGTAHVSRVSAEAVRILVEHEGFDAIAVELCESRYNAMRNPQSLYQLDLFQVIRTGKAGLVAANLALSAFQRRLAEQFGIEPGAEMKMAIDLADSRALPLWLIDREVGITLKRAYRSVGFLDRFGIIGGLMSSLFNTDNISEEEIEKLKQGDVLTSMFDEFARSSEPLYRALIGERDSFMVARLRHESVHQSLKKVLIVIGAGHLSGMERELVTQQTNPNELLNSLKASPPPARWPKFIGIGLLVVIMSAIVFAFSRNASQGTAALKEWIFFTGGLSALGALLGGAHMLSVLVAFIVGPLKPFRPLLPVGAIVAGVELWLYRPLVADFESLRNDVMHWTGWWKNRVARTLLIFMFTNFGMMVGQYLAGIRIIKNLF